MGRLFRLRTLIVIVLAATVASVVATIVNQKQRLQVMTALERRQYLGDKLGGRMTDEQIDKLAAAVSERLDGKSPVAEAAEKIADEADDVAEAVEEAVEEAIEES